MSRSGQHVLLLSRSPDISQDGADAGLMDRFPSYGIRRVQAAVLADPALAGVTTALVDRPDASADDHVRTVLEQRPDVLGLSLYVWSTELFLEVAQRVRSALPGCTIIGGGPSAHPRVLDGAPFRRAARALDAVVLGEGEETFRAIVGLADRSRSALRAVAGLAIPGPLGWYTTEKRSLDPDLDRLASPFQMGLVPGNRVAYLETFRGCPLSCTFCQWGVMDSKRHFSRDYLVRELRAIGDTQPFCVYLVDAGLNLNPRAFRNLVDAEAEVGALARTMVLCEVYPDLVKDEHLELVSRFGAVHFGVGVQSLDDDALRTVSRRQRADRIARVIDRISPYGLVDAELILGLPGDTLAGFRRTLEVAMSLPCNVRIYRCLALPDALLTRSPESHEVRYDPRTLRLTSCHTWPEADLRRAQDDLDRLAASRRGSIVGDYWWQFVHASARYQKAYEIPAHGAPVGRAAGPGDLAEAAQ